VVIAGDKGGDPRKWNRVETAAGASRARTLVVEVRTLPLCCTFDEKVQRPFSSAARIPLSRMHLA